MQIFAKTQRRRPLRIFAGKQLEDSCIQKIEPSDTIDNVKAKILPSNITYSIG